MTRDEWKSRSRAFEASAATLLAARQYDIAYYLAGVAVECALKAKIAGLFRGNAIPDRKLVSDIYQHGHDLTALLRYAQLEAALAHEEALSAVFSANWDVVRDWTVASRYLVWSEQEAVTMLAAVRQRRTGVLPWIRRHWCIRISKPAAPWSMRSRKRDYRLQWLHGSISR
jgi:HEPN domain-containing protein